MFCNFQLPLLDGKDHEKILVAVAKMEKTNRRHFNQRRLSMQEGQSSKIAMFAVLIVKSFGTFPLTASEEGEECADGPLRLHYSLIQFVNRYLINRKRRTFILF